MASAAKYVHTRRHFRTTNKEYDTTVIRTFEYLGCVGKEYTLSRPVTRASTFWPVFKSVAEQPRHRQSLPRVVTTNPAWQQQALSGFLNPFSLAKLSTNELPPFMPIITFARAPRASGGKHKLLQVCLADEHIDRSQPMQLSCAATTGDTAQILYLWRYRPGKASLRVWMASTVIPYNISFEPDFERESVRLFGT